MTGGKFVAVGLTLALATASENAQQSVPGVRTEVVRLDAVVTDADGNLVRDLSLEDFELRDDGKLQQLTHFAFVGKAAATAGATAAVGEHGLAATGELAPDRQIAILVDDLHIAPGNLQFVKQALHRLLEEFLLPSDNVALITTSAPAGSQELTHDGAILGEAVDALSLRQAVMAPARGSQMTPEQAELILRGDRNALLLAGKMIREEPGSIYSNNGGPRAAVTGAPGANPGAVGEDSQERAASVEAQQQARAALAEALRFSSASLSKIDDVLRGLASLPGRKLCLLVSEGFLVGAGTSEERTVELRRIVDAATRSGAVVYALDARGLATEQPDTAATGGGGSSNLQSSVARQANVLLRTTLETVSNDTGGFLVRATNDLAGGLRRMLEDNEAYYVMAYEPTNQKRDGRFRKIELRVASRRQLVVRTRKGYYAPDDRKQPGGPSQGLTETESRAALSQPMPNTEALRLSADFMALPPAGAQVVVRAHIDVAGLAWKRTDAKFHAALQIVGGAYDAEGNPIGGLVGGRRDLDLGKGQYERAKAEGIDFQQQVALDPGRYQIRVLARNLEGKLIGGAAQWVEIPNLADKKLALSGVFLSSSPSAPPKTVRRFSRSDGLYFQFYVYNPAVDPDGSSDALIQAQIWSQSKLAAASKPQPATLLVKDGVSIAQANGMSLESLAPGAYELRIVVVDRRANVTANRSVDFTVR